MSFKEIKKIYLNAFMFFLIIIVIHLLSYHCVQAQTTPYKVWLESGTIKVRQVEPINPKGKIFLKCARNEFEPFQVVIQANDSLKLVSVEISDFKGTEGVILKDNVTIFRVGYQNITNKSDIESGLGEWPDILIPDVDAYYKEKRNAFPFSIGPNRIQPIWFDVFVPTTAKTGDYSAKVTINAECNSGQKISINVDSIYLHVWNFTLPATASLHSRFGLNSSGVHYGYYGDIWKTTYSMKTVVELHRLYMRAGLRHRISLSPMDITISGWDSVKYTNVSDNYFKETTTGFIGGSSVPLVEYGNSMLTSLFSDFSPIYRKYMDCDGDTIPSAMLLKEVQQRCDVLKSLLNESMKDRYFILPIDEPGGGEVGCGFANPVLDYKSTVEMAKIIKKTGLKTRTTKRRIPELLNTSETPAKNDYFDMWVAPFNRIAGRDYSTQKYVSTRSEYDTDLVNGAQLWWYQGCNTHGCGITGGHEYDGYPQYLVEFDGIRARIFAWMAFKYDVKGELYWGVEASYYLGASGAGTGDPWFTLWNSYAGNGEGTLFYPGVADTKKNCLPFKVTSSAGKTTERGAHTPSIGGVHDIPIESIRLKMIREGYEDYEYLNRLSYLGDSVYARNLVNKIIKNTFEYNQDPAILESIKDSLAFRILKNPKGSDSPATIIADADLKNKICSQPAIRSQKQGLVIDWSLSSKKPVKCEIFDARGSLIVKQRFLPGRGINIIRWNDLIKGKSTGCYFVMLTADGMKKNQKLFYGKSDL